MNENIDDKHLHSRDSRIFMTWFSELEFVLKFSYYFFFSFNFTIYSETVEQMLFFKLITNIVTFALV